MRYKVNFHVLLWFLSSCTTIIMSNQETLHRSNDNKHHPAATKHAHAPDANDAGKAHKAGHNSAAESHSVGAQIRSPLNDSFDADGVDAAGKRC